MDDNIKVAEKIFKSRKINECKMKEMKVRFDMIERIQEETRQSLAEKTKNPTTYRALLKGLIQQGLIKLLEENVDVRCLRCDEKVVSEVMAECEREFNTECETKTKIKINVNNYLG
jgi:V-type H+-transporting ATPase subunit E